MAVLSGDKIAGAAIGPAAAIGAVGGLSSDVDVEDGAGGDGELGGDDAAEGSALGKEQRDTARGGGDLELDFVDVGGDGELLDGAGVVEPLRVGDGAFLLGGAAGQSPEREPSGGGVEADAGAGADGADLELADCWGEVFLALREGERDGVAVDDVEDGDGVEEVAGGGVAGGDGDGAGADADAVEGETEDPFGALDGLEGEAGKDGRALPDSALDVRVEVGEQFPLERALAAVGAGAVGDDGVEGGELDDAVGRREGLAEDTNDAGLDGVDEVVVDDGDAVADGVRGFVDAGELAEVEDVALVERLPSGELGELEDGGGVELDVVDERGVAPND